MTTKYKKYRIAIINEKNYGRKPLLSERVRKLLLENVFVICIMNQTVMWRILKVLYLNGEFLLIKLKLSSERTDE